MSIATLLNKSYDNILKLNNTKVIVLFDEVNNVWFSYNDILNALGYKDAKTQKKRLNIDNQYFDTFKNIYSKSTMNKYDQNTVSHRLKMISESGLYALLHKSKKPLASKLGEQLFSQVLPELRKSGIYKLTKREFNTMERLTKKIKNLKLELNRTKKQSINNNDTGKGYIYILEINTPHNGKDTKCFKIGYTSNLERRMATYKTGNPDVKLAHHENINCNKKQLEKCIINLNHLKLLKRKSEIICNTTLKELKSEIEDCKKLLTKHSLST